MSTKGAEVLCMTGAAGGAECSCLENFLLSAEQLGRRTHTCIWFYGQQMENMHRGCQLFECGCLCKLELRQVCFSNWTKEQSTTSMSRLRSSTAQRNPDQLIVQINERDPKPLCSDRTEKVHKKVPCLFLVYLPFAELPNCRTAQTSV